MIIIVFLERHLSHSANIEEFKTILGELNEKSKLFSDDQLKEIISHLLITFFQNNRLFEFVINEPQAEVSITKEVINLNIILIIKKI